jgi:hypothetical protein
MAREEESGVEGGFVAQQQQAFGICVQPTDRIDPRRKFEIGEGTIGRAVRCELGEDTIRFVEGDQHGKDLAR